MRLKGLQRIEAYSIPWYLNHCHNRENSSETLLELLPLLLSKCMEHNLRMSMSSIVSSLLDFLMRVSDQERHAISHRKTEGQQHTTPDHGIARGLPSGSAHVVCAKVYSIVAVFIHSIHSSKELMKASYFSAAFETETSLSLTGGRRIVATVLYRAILGSLACPGWVLMGAFLKELLQCLSLSQSSSISVAQKSIEFRTQLKHRLQKYFPFHGEEKLFSPFNADHTLVAINYEKCKIFPSSRAPALVEFVSESMEAHDKRTGITRIILKRGDDLRIDSMVITLQSEINNLLKKVGLDLQPALYGVIPLGDNEGIVEYVEGVALSSLQKNHNGSILEYLKIFHADDSESSGVEKVILQRFVQSTAFGCVFCYVFGVQDRHLDNILLCKDGTLVHIDFAYMFGQDPKASASQVRLTRPMVDAMGGEFSNLYENFQKVCCLAYNALRKFRVEVHVLISSYVNSGLPYVTKKDNRKVLHFIDERLRIDLTGVQFNFSITVSQNDSQMRMPLSTYVMC